MARGCFIFFFSSLSLSLFHNTFDFFFCVCVCVGVRQHPQWFSGGEQLGQVCVCVGGVGVRTKKRIKTKRIVAQQPFWVFFFFLNQKKGVDSDPQTRYTASHALPHRYLAHLFRLRYFWCGHVLGYVSLRKKKKKN